MLSRFLGIYRQLIPLAAARPDDRRRARTVQLAPEPLNVNVYDVRHRVVMLVPDVLGNVPAADNGAGVMHEKLEQRVFLGGEPHLATSHPRPATARVERQTAHRQALGHEWQPPSTDESTKPRLELTEIVRLHEIVV